LSPILVRPIREQLEHDRVIRLLQAKYKRKFEVSINPGHEQTTPVLVGASDWYPDLVLHSSDTRPRLLGMVEVETAESVNHLEALSQWATFARLRAPLHLYVPVTSVDPARRLCASLNISVSEIWAYNALGDQILFTLVHRLPTRASRGGRASNTQKPARQAASTRQAGSTRQAASKRTAPARAKSGRAATRKTAGKKPVARTAVPRKVAGVAKKVVKRVPKKAAKKVLKKVLKKVAKPTRPTRSVNAARPARTAKKASTSSRPMKR
jgi:hypothetical protein